MLVFPKGMRPCTFCQEKTVTLFLLLETIIPTKNMVSRARALTVAPFQGPIGAAKVGYKDGQYLLNPTKSELEDSQLELVVAGTRTDIAMVEGAARQVSEDVVLEGLKLAQAEIAKICEAQETLRLIGELAQFDDQEAAA